MREFLSKTAVAAVMALWLWAGDAHAQMPGAQGEAPPTPVTVVTLKPEDVTVTATLPGRVVASGVAEVRPQVNGIITERLFSEGADVKVGDPLYRIDAQSYRVRVNAARAQVAQAEAKLKVSISDAERLQALKERRVASEQNYEAAVAERESAAAALEVAKADLNAAEIDLERTTIVAPLSGVIGRSLTTQGALVTSGQAQALAVIRTIDPVLVDVTQSAAEIIEWRRGEAAERLTDADKSVKLTLADGVVYAHAGSLTAAEPNVNEQTGVVTLRLEFPNPERLLLPGMYVQVEMPQGVARGALLVPMEGVSRDRRGDPVAMVASAENVVEQRQLTVLKAQGSNWIVTKGLAAGDRVIVEGLQKIRPGGKVVAQERGATAPAPGAAGAAPGK
ncbi:MAG: efflux RND transporter periplasmic adaptor subunit [Flavobacteriaceae bacterium]